MFGNSLINAANTHKKIFENYVNSSTKSVHFKVVRDDIQESTGASMFGDFLEEGQNHILVGPFKCIWTDADSARVGENSREVGFLQRYMGAQVYLKLVLEELLLEPGKTYGELLVDRSISLVSDGFEYNILGYDRYGLGVIDPYVLAIAIRGTYADETN